MKILSNAASRLKDNPYAGNVIGIGADFAKKTQQRRKVASAVQETPKKEIRGRPCNPKIY